MVKMILRDLLLSLTFFFLLSGGNQLFAAGASNVTAGATVLSNSNCRFRAPGTATLNFGTLDAGNPVDVTVTATMEIRCGGPAPTATYLITDDDGLYESGLGAPQMRHASTFTAFLPYAFSYAPATATIPRNVNTPITLTGTVTGASYQTALVGSYADTVTLTINP